MRQIVTVENIAVDQGLYDFVNSEVLPGTGLQQQDFWHGFAGRDGAAQRRVAAPSR